MCADMIKDGFNGANNWLKINDDGSINTTTNISGGITFSGTLIVDDVNGTMFMVSGNAWSGIGSVTVTNSLSIATGSESWVRGIVGENCGSNSFVGSVLANGSYVGLWENTLPYSAMNIFIKQQDGGYLQIQNSMDGSTIDRSTTVSPGSNIGTFYSLAPRGNYFRIVYMNGSIDNILRLQTVCSPAERGASYLPVNQPFSDNFTVLSTRSVLTAKTAAGSYTNIGVTNGGNLKVSIENWDGPIGSVYSFETNPTSTNKFNYQTVIVYSGLDAAGSIYRNHSTGSWVQVLTYDVNGNVTRVSNWSQV